MRLQARHPFLLGDRQLGGPQVLTCTPLVARDRGELIREARLVGGLKPDCIEWRCDFIADLTPAETPALLGAVAAAAGRPLIVTNRHHCEGGARPQEESGRLAVLAAAAATGIAPLIDLELRTDPARTGDVIAAAKARGVGLIRSWHNFAETPGADLLAARLREAQETGADVAKVAVTPQTPEDVLRVLTVGLMARQTFLEIPCVLMSMGPLGCVTRVSGGFYGSDLTFAIGSSSSAPGQMPLDLVARCLTVQGLGNEP